MPRAPKVDKCDQPVQTYVPRPVLDALEDAARADGRSRADIIRRAIIADLTRRSRAAQGLPEQVEDRAVLARVADLLRKAVD
jgi:hypothetical protein